MSGDDAGNLPSPASTGASNATPLQTPSPSYSGPSQIVPRLSIGSRRLTSASITPNLPLNTASSPSDHGHPSPGGAGPTSTSYVVPPRPKPGRKPATDEPASKRKAQNRESQRAFRARKAAKLTEMQSQLETTEQRHKREKNEMIAQNHALLAEKAQFEQREAHLLEAQKRSLQELEFWKNKAMQYEADLERVYKQQHVQMQRQDSPNRQSIPGMGTMVNVQQPYVPKPVDFGCGNCQTDGKCACVDEMTNMPDTQAFMASVPIITPPQNMTSPVKDLPTPAVDLWSDREIDFTAQFSTKRSRPDQRPSIPFMISDSNAQDQRQDHTIQGHESLCGFCTDKSNCFCQDTSVQDQDMQDTSRDLSQLTRDWDLSSSIPKTSDNSKTTGPGTCSDCMSNPQQRAWCQRIAQLKTPNSDYLSTSGSSRGSRVSTPLETMEPVVDTSFNTTGRYSVGCRDAFKLFEGRVSMDQGKMDWVNNLKPISPTTREDPLPNMQRKYSALEIDAAGIITTLQHHSFKPLVPRQSDGEMASLVLMAEQQRRASASP
ncbi:hypothetical protein P154DRAFT_537968 [Amniculicola lignicola CBS 123094]|uniref:BZIP domain-containing protein n=1 Tax=Amniculicola lignicola CBS 123094 TaxID=1392246 RepID=A0A6A5W6K5_9PLEO|nr:hypothetical protein P154DRAFT_537968 [Amniculicola lignicola CBS 123094]